MVCRKSNSMKPKRLRCRPPCGNGGTLSVAILIHAAACASQHVEPLAQVAYKQRMVAAPWLRINIGSGLALVTGVYA